MRCDDLERLAHDLRARVGLGPADVEVAPRIAVRLIGPRAIACAHDMLVQAYLVHDERGWRIVARPGAPDLNWAIAHELAHYALRKLVGFRGSLEREERAANYLGAALLAAPEAVMRAFGSYGNRVDRVADTFGISQTCAWLRLAEVLGDERAVVTRTGQALIRTAGAFAWDEVAIVDMARGRRRLPRAMKKATLRGGIDDGRVALVAT